MNHVGLVIMCHGQSMEIVSTCCVISIYEFIKLVQFIKRLTLSQSLSPPPLSQSLSLCLSLSSSNNFLSRLLCLTKPPNNFLSRLLCLTKPPNNLLQTIHASSLFIKHHTCPKNPIKHFPFSPPLSHKTIKNHPFNHIYHIYGIFFS